MTEIEWVMIRVRRPTHARLQEARASLFRAQDNGQIALEVDARDRVSLDQVINLLLNARDDHKARRKRSQRMKTILSNQQLLERFDEHWRTMSELGACDAIGGCEYQRVLQEWIAAKRPRTIPAFILKHAQ